MLSKVGGTVTGRRTLECTISRIHPTLATRPRTLRDASRSGGNQPAHQSMINRRYMIVPPALLSGGYAEQLEGQERNFCACSLKRRTLEYSVSMKQLLSRGLADLVGPGVNHRVGVDVIEIGEDACLEFSLRCDANVVEHRARHLREEAFHQIEP